MSRALLDRGLVIAHEAKDATARCRVKGCSFTSRWVGDGAETPALEMAKQHAEQTGHRVRVDYTRQVEYDRWSVAVDNRITNIAKSRATQVANQ